MIQYLKGKIELKEEKFLVVEVAGLGYKVFCSPATLQKLSAGKEVKLFTHLHLKETAIELYGFLAQEELGLFEVLNEISGIGPKTAMMLASLGSLQKLKEIIEKRELPAEIKGIGNKRMQKILLELTGKIGEIGKKPVSTRVDEAVQSLVSLGFSRSQAKEALARIPGETQNPEGRIKEALRILGRSSQAKSG